jgi:hypothetical protein
MDNGLESRLKAFCYDLSSHNPRDSRAFTEYTNARASRPSKPAHPVLVSEVTWAALM